MNVVFEVVEAGGAALLATSVMIAGPCGRVEALLVVVFNLLVYLLQAGVQLLRYLLWEVTLRVGGAQQHWQAAGVDHWLLGWRVLVNLLDGSLVLRRRHLLFVW